MKTKTQFMNRILSLMLSIMMVVSMLPMNALTASAAEGDKVSVTIGGETTYYTSIIDAVAKANGSDNATITLLQDTTTGERLDITKSATLDLNGNTLSCATNFSNDYNTMVAVTTDGAKLTIIDSIGGGKLDGTGTTFVLYLGDPSRQGVVTFTSSAQISGGTVSGGVRMRSGTSMTISGGTLENNAALATIEMYSETTLNVSGGEILNTAFSMEAISNMNGGTVIISGGTVNASGDYADAIWTQNSGRVEISGGNIFGSRYDLRAYSEDTVELTGGTFPGGITIYGKTLNACLGDGFSYWAGNTMLTVADDAASITDKGEITIRATCNHSGNTNDYTDNVDGTHSFTCTVCQTAVNEAHTFTNGVCSACDYVCPHSNFDSATGNCTDCETALAIAKIKTGETTIYYQTADELRTAVDLSGDDQAITLLADLAIKDTFFFNANGTKNTLDLNGYTLICSDPIMGRIKLGACELAITGTGSINVFMGADSEGSKIIVGRDVTLNNALRSAYGGVLDLTNATIPEAGLNVILYSDDWDPTTYNVSDVLKLPADHYFFVDGKAVSSYSEETVGTVLKHTDHSYTYTDNGDGTHDATCSVCGKMVDNEAHTIENHVCTACGAMEITVSFDAGNYEWKTGDQICLLREAEFIDDCVFTATVAEDGTVTWTADKPFCWYGEGNQKLFAAPNNGWSIDYFVIPEDQSTAAKLDEADLINGMWVGTPTTDTITFNMTHRMAKVTVNYEFAEGVTADISELKVYSIAQICLFSIDDWSIKLTSAGQADVWVTPYLDGNQFTAFIIPETYATGEDFIKITLSDGTVREVKMNKDVTFADGAEYTYKVVITADSAYLTCADECTFEYTDNEDGLTHSKTCSKCGYVAASEAHSGGTATCTEQAICGNCGASYGELDANKHSYTSNECCGYCGAEGDGTNVKWTLVDGKMTITGSGAMAVYQMLDIPWENHTDDITSVTIGEGVTTISENAFVNCTKLATVTIPNTVTTIGRGAFSRCYALTEVTIPGSVDVVDTTVFLNCTSLKKVTIEAGVKTIGEGAFFGCEVLPQVTIPNTVTTIGNFAFRKCAALTQVTIPNSVTTIGDAAFNECAALTTVTIPNTVTSIGIDAFALCDVLTTVNVPCSWNENPLYTFGNNVTVNVAEHSLDEKGYTVDDSTHSFTCTVCGPIVKEHSYVNGECVCEKLATYSITCTENGSNAGMVRLSNKEPATHGKQYRTYILNPEGIQGWYTNVTKVLVNGTEIDYTYNLWAVELVIDGDKVTGDIEIVYQVNAKVTFDLNGGDVEPELKTQLELNGLNVTDGKIAMPLAYGVPSSFGSTVEALNRVFLREGYSCSGLKNGEKDADMTAPVVNCTLTVQWEPNVYEVKWYVDGEVYTTTQQTYDAKLQLPAAPTKDNYDFAGWFTQETGGVRVDENTIFQNTNNDTVYYANWCDHANSEHTTVTDNGDSTHSYTCSSCGNLVTKDHTMDSATGKCVCGLEMAAASVTKSVAGGIVGIGSTTYYETLDGAIRAVNTCTAGDYATVQLLQDVDLGSSHQTISSGVFTLDLNGKTITGSQIIVLDITGGTVTIDDSADGGSIASTYTNAFGVTVRISGGTVNVVDGTIYTSEESTLSEAVEVTSGNLTVSGGNIIGGFSGTGVFALGGSVTITGGSISGNDGVYSQDSTLTVTGGNISGVFALHISGGNTTITGGTITGSTYDIREADDSSIALALADGKTQGATFPGGITVGDTTLNEVLGSDMAYWQGGKMIVPADGQTEISGGDVTIKVACKHENGTVAYTPTADGTQHVVNWSCCGAAVTEDHTLIYTAKDNVITAVCSANCGCGGTATISATGKTYDGTAVEVIVSKTGSLENTVIPVTLTTDGEAFTGEPVNVGTYTASIGMGEGENAVVASVEFIIEKANPVIAAAPTPNTLTYTGEGQYLISQGEAAGGTMVYSLTENGDYTTTIPQGTNAGDYTVWYYVQGDANHNDSAKDSVSVTIEKATVTVTADPKTKAYGDADPKLTYTVNGLFGEDKLTGALSREEGENAGSYAITLGTLTAGDNYTISFTDAELTITDNTAPTGTILIKENGWSKFWNTITFGIFCKDYVDVTITADGTGSGVTKVEYLLSGTALEENNIPNDGWTTLNADNGKYSFSIKPQNKVAVYVRITDEGGNVTVINSDGVVVYEDSEAVDTEGTYTYKGNSNKDIAVEFNGNTVKSIVCGEKVLAANSDYTVDYESGKIVLTASYLDALNAGDYTYTVSYNPMGVENSGVTDLTTTFIVKVEPTSIDGAAVNVSGTFTYDGNAKTPDPMVVLNGETLVKDRDYTVSYAENVNAGTATVTVTGKGNYSGTASGSFRIDRAKLTDISVQQNGKLTYNGEALTPAVTANATALNGAKVYFIYSADGSAYGSMPTFTDAGTYTVYYCAYTVDNNFFDHHDTFTVTIDKATVTEPTIASKPYSGSAQTADISDTDLYTVEKNNGGTEKGSYEVVLKLKDSANYKWSTTDNAEVTLQFVISAAQNDWDTNPSISGWTYGEAAKTPVGTAKYGAVKVVYTGKANDGTDYNSETAPTKVGNYTATFTVTGTEDYSGLSEQVNFTIAKKAVTVTANDASKTYGESDPALTYTHTELVGSDALVITVARTSGENANTYTITASQAEGANPNYEITFKTGTFTIHKATLNVTVEDKTATYGDAVPTYTVKYEGFKNGDDKDDLSGALVFDCGYAQFSDKGEYTIKASGYTSGNYTISYVDGKLTVNAKPITVTIQNATSVYGDTLAELKATDNGIVNGDANVYSLATTATGTSNVGKYAITGTALDSNYDVTFVNGEYEITKREITITVDAKNTVVNTTLPTYTYKVEGLVGVDTLVTEPTLTCNANITLIGEYDITATGADAGGNYSIKYVPAKLTVLTDNAVDAAAGYTEELKDYDPATVTSEDKAELDEMLSEINTILADETTTDNGKKALEEVKEQVEKLIKEITDAAEATDTENTEKVENVTPENVTPENKTDLEGAKADLEKALEDNGGNYTEDEKKAIEEEIKRIDDALEVIGNVEAVEEVISKLPAVDTVKPDDEEAIKAITNAQTAYNALSDYEKSLVDEATKAALDKLAAALVAYDIVEGDGSSWTEDSDHNITFVVNGLFSKFVGIKVDGKDVDKANYEVKAGSTIITLKASYLDTLAVGEHTITVVYTDGSTDGTFNVHAKANSPATGDDFNIALYGSLMVVSVTALVVLLLASKKRKQAK